MQMLRLIGRDFIGKRSSTKKKSEDMSATSG